MPLFALAGFSLFAATSGFAAAEDGALGTLYQRIAADVRAGQPLGVRIYVALCDNASQGIVPVKNPAICDGEKPERNLYWGGGGGLYGYLKKNGWRAAVTERPKTGPVLIRSVWQKRIRSSSRASPWAPNENVDVEIEAFAYRGREILRAMADYLADVHGAATAPEPSHLLGYIGHNVLLDTQQNLLPGNERRADHHEARGVFALSCYGEQRIRPLITRPSAPILLLNRSLTFPGAWTVGGIVEAIVGGRDARGIHRSATLHFARGKKRPPESLSGVFSYGASRPR